MESYYCYEKADINFGGPDQLGQYNFVNLIVRLCNKETEAKYNITCATSEEKDKRYKDKKAYMKVLYQHNIFHASNHNNPYSPAYFYDSSGLNILDTKLVLYNDLYYRKAYVENDIGVIFQEFSGTSFLEFDLFESSLEPPATGEDYIAKITIKTSRADKTYYRAYIKIPDIIAAVGGFTSLIQSFIAFFYTFYLENEFNLYLYEKLFDLQIDDQCNEINDESKDIIKIGKSGKANVNEKDLSLFGDTSLELTNGKSPKKYMFQTVLQNNEDKKNDIVINKDINKLLEYRKRKRTEIEISKWERNIFLCCNFTPKSKEEKLKYELMMAAEKAIEQKTEIFEVWKTIDQLRLLTNDWAVGSRLIVMLVLNENQSFMIQNRGKQLITNEKEFVLDKVKILDEDKFEKKTNKLTTYLQERKDSKTLTVIDTLLFRY